MSIILPGNVALALLFVFISVTQLYTRKIEHAIFFMLSAIASYVIFM